MFLLTLRDNKEDGATLFKIVMARKSSFSLRKKMMQSVMQCSWKIMKMQKWTL